MHRCLAMVALALLSILAAATAATASRNSRPGVKPAPVKVCPEQPAAKPHEDGGNGGGNGGQGNGGENGPGQGQGQGNTPTTDTEGNGNSGQGGDSGQGGGNSGDHGSPNAGEGQGNSGQGGGNANGHGNSENGQAHGNGNGQGNGNQGGDDAECVTPPSDPAPGDVAGDGTLPPAQVGENVNVEPVEGKVNVKVPGSDNFKALDGSAQLPAGTVVDARTGTLQLTSAAGTDNAQQTAALSGAKFEVRQEKAKAAVTELVLRGGDFQDCPRLDHTRRAQQVRNGFIAARGGKRRRLFGNGHGRFRTRGRWGSATVRGTIWQVEDRCEGTQTTVLRGVVQVTDFGLDRTVAVRAGESYFSRVRP